MMMGTPLFQWLPSIQWLWLFGWEDYGERVNPHNPPNGQGMPDQSPLAPTLLPLLVTRWGSWAGWGKPQQLNLLISWGFPHLTPPRGSQRATGHWQFQGYSFGVVNDTAKFRSPLQEEYNLFDYHRNHYVFNHHDAFNHHCNHDLFDHHHNHDLFDHHHNHDVINSNPRFHA